MPAYPIRTFMVTPATCVTYKRLDKIAMLRPHSPYALLHQLLLVGMITVPPKILLTIAQDCMRKDEKVFPLPCTEISQPGEMIQFRWQAYLEGTLDTEKYLERFRWQFFDPAQVKRDLEIMRATEDPAMAKLVPLTIIVAEHEL